MTISTLKTVPLLLICSILLSTGIAQNLQTDTFLLTTPDSLQLAGEINYPDQEGPFPTAILIWGNGPHTREVAISGSPLFTQMAETLCRQGMAVVRIDKRGFGKSSGTFTSEGNYTTRDLVNDIKTVYQYINKHPKVDTSKVGLIGTSEGSIITGMIAAEEPSLDWAIVFGPPAVSGDIIRIEQSRLNRERMGLSEEASEAVGKVWEKYIEFIKSGFKSDSVYYAIGREFLLAHGLPEDDERINNAFIDQLLDAYKTSWNQFFYTYDPAEDLEKIGLPFLAVFGGADKQTTVELNLVPMQKALERAGNKKYRIVVLPDEDHFFVRYKDQRMKKHQFGEMKVSGRLMDTIIGWLRSEKVISSSR